MRHSIAKKSLSDHTLWNIRDKITYVKVIIVCDLKLMDVCLYIFIIFRNNVLVYC